MVKVAVWPRRAGERWQFPGTRTAWIVELCRPAFSSFEYLITAKLHEVTHIAILQNLSNPDR
jgi:hypothetical protein